MRAPRLFTLSLLLIACLFAACGPSDEELSATATAEMVSLAATQTAEAPTPTPELSLSEAPQQPGSAWRHYTIDDGLVVNNITSIAAAADGSLWFGSAGAGVSRFDGGAWTTYTSNDGLMYNYVNDIAAAADGSIWIATQRGLSHWQEGSWTSYTTEDGLPGKSVYSAAIDLDGAVWVYSLNTDLADFPNTSGVSVLDGATWTTYKTVGWTLSIVVSPDGMLWFATEDGAVRFDGQNWETYTTNNGLPSNYVVAIAIDPDGMVWAAISTETGIAFSRFDGAKWITETTLDTTLPLGPGRPFAINKDGTLLFSTEIAVYRFEGGAWTELVSDDGFELRLSGSHTSYVAPDGAEWFATRFGVFRYGPAE